MEDLEYNLRPSAIGREKPFPAGVDGPCLSCTEARSTRSRSERRPNMRMVSMRYINDIGTRPSAAWSFLAILGTVKPHFGGSNSHQSGDGGQGSKLRFGGSRIPQNVKGED